MSQHQFDGNLANIEENIQKYRTNVCDPIWVNDDVFISHFQITMTTTGCNEVLLPVDKKKDFVLRLHLLQSCFQESDFLASSWSSHVVATFPWLTSTNNL